jgi:hypothetical protein
VNGLSFLGGCAPSCPYCGAVGGYWNSGGNIYIINCTVSNTAASGIYFKGAFSSQTPTTFVVSNCALGTIGAHGIFAQYGMTNLQIRSCWLGDCGQNTSATLTGDCIGIFNTAGTGVNTNALILGNDIANAPIKSPIILSGLVAGTLTESNYFHGTFGDSGLDVSGGCYTNITIRNNVWDIAVPNFFGPMAFTAPNGANCVDGIHVYNNTVRATVPSSGALVYFWRGANTATAAFFHVAITNNILVQSSSGQPMIRVDANSAGTAPIVDPTTFGCDYNVYQTNSGAKGSFTWNGQAVNWGTWKSDTGGDAHSILGSPVFAGPADLHLAASDTAARGNGSSLSAFFTRDKDSSPRNQVGPWDIGAYEHPRPPSPLNLRVGP